MITFTLHLPPLTEAQQLALEEALFKIPQVDAMGLNAAGEAFQVTASQDVLRDMVATLYSWASQYPGMLLQSVAQCPQKASMVLGKHSPNDLIHYLATCK